MPAKDTKNEGSQPIGGNAALLIVDMISDFQFEDGEKLYPRALKAAESLAVLKSRAKAAGVPVIFVNDNYGKWNEDFRSYVASIRERSEIGRRIMELVGPEDGDYHILKPQRSAFYATPLGVLLLTLDVSNLVLAGVTTDICILFSAHDAYMRGFNVHIPSDCTAAVEQSYHTEALELIQRVIHADVRPSAEMEFKKQASAKPDENSRAIGHKAGSE